MFLDQPTTGLDPTSRTRMWNVIRGLVADGATLLLTTQYLDEAGVTVDDVQVHPALARRRLHRPHRTRRRGSETSPSSRAATSSTSPASAAALGRDRPARPVIDHFRTLPMWKPAVLVGRSLADLLTAALCSLIVAVTGLAIGWRAEHGLLDALAAFGVFLLFS
ncbi:MAG TPA: hypothetical protein VHC45_06670 [Gaiellaceae bacterium]|nr:hypothetical protein [Gaiellaceae bacterium]